LKSLWTWGFPAETSRDASEIPVRCSLAHFSLAKLPAVRQTLALF
jgi:hypothetical protein